MPYSEQDNKQWIMNQIQTHVQPKSVLDVGVGAGIYGGLLRVYAPDAVVDGVEIWEPYVEMFGLRNKYKNLYVQDVRKMDKFGYDLVIMGDVLEHMSEEDAVALWEKVSKQAKWAILSVPIIHHPQGIEFGNPYEVHVEEDWNVERVLSSFSHIIDHEVFPITGAFLARFDND